MAKLTRVIQKIFGDTGGTSEFGIFGSNAASPPGTKSKDLTAIQSLSQYLSGWFSATANAAEPPRIEDRNAIDLLIRMVHRNMKLVRNIMPMFLLFRLMELFIRRYSATMQVMIIQIKSLQQIPYGGEWYLIFLSLIHGIRLKL
jgi:hypothetical protein